MKRRVDCDCEHIHNLETLMATHYTYYPDRLAKPHNQQRGHHTIGINDEDEDEDGRLDHRTTNAEECMYCCSYCAKKRKVKSRFCVCGRDGFDSTRVLRLNIPTPFFFLLVGLSYLVSWGSERETKSHHSLFILSLSLLVA